TCSASLSLRDALPIYMDGNGWADIAYSMWVCNHTAGMGRGPGVLTAANGPGLNADHYSILFLVGTSGVTKPTDNMKRHFHEARRSEEHTSELQSRENL